jgi:hypothetical protein
VSEDRLPLFVLHFWAVQSFNDCCDFLVTVTATLTLVLLGQ